MANILFVHGTGSRELDYAASLRKLQGNLSEHHILPCLWGDAYGARFQLGGAAIPEYDASKAPKPTDPAEQDKARWWLLYQDPLFELRLLEDRPGDQLPIPPTMDQPGEEAVAKTKSLQAPNEFIKIIRSLGLEESWPEAFSQVVEAEEFERLITAANLPVLDTTRPIARALVACLIGCAEVRGVAPPTGKDRDAMVELLIPALGGSPMGLMSWGVGVLLGIAARPAGKWLRSNKKGVFDEHASKVADIVHYQARGQKIREFIKKRILESGPDVYVLCHSLGGIACVDLLAEQPMKEVKALITVGSQAGFFYEINGLVSLEFGQRLPDKFPTWQNFYDPADFLSYKAAPSFPGKVTDIEVDNGQPFPQSHSAYWDNADVLAGIRKLVNAPAIP